MLCLAGIYRYRKTGDVSGCRSKACLVMGSFSRKGKVVVVLQRIGRFNNRWGFIFSRSSEGPACGISTLHRSAKRETAELSVVHRVCLLHQGFIGNGVTISTGIFSPES